MSTQEQNPDSRLDLLAAAGCQRIFCDKASAMAGYADQSHLNRAARRLAGATPGELVA